MAYPEWMERGIKRGIIDRLSNGVLRYLLEESLHSGYLSSSSLSGLEVIDWTKLSNPDVDLSLDPVTLDFKAVLKQYLHYVDSPTLIQWFGEAVEEAKRLERTH